jgi:hypothetical protein
MHEKRSKRPFFLIILDDLCVRIQARNPQIDGKLGPEVELAAANALQHQCSDIVLCRHPAWAPILYRLRPARCCGDTIHSTSKT